MPDLGASFPHFGFWEIVLGLGLLIVLDLPFRYPKRPGRSPLNRPSARI